MEEKIIPLKHRLKYMLGPRFDSMKHTRNGATIARGYYVFFGFYWFCIAVFRRWPLDFMDCYATGFSFSYKPNSKLREGDLMWAQNKKYLRFHRREDLHHAAQVQATNDK